MLSSHHETPHLPRPEIQKTCHFWKSGECDAPLRTSFFLPLSILLCVPCFDWQLEMGVGVCEDRIHLLSARLYTPRFVFTTAGQQWHIEVFNSCKQVAEEREEFVHISLLPSPSPAEMHWTNLCTVSLSGRGYMCLPARVRFHHSHFGVCYTWRFAPKANKSVMPGIRPWPLLKLHRQAERLINQTTSHRCDGFHTNRQQTVKVTSNRVNCQPGRQAGCTFFPTPLSFPLCCIYLPLSL